MPVLLSQVISTKRPSNTPPPSSLSGAALVSLSKKSFGFLTGFKMPLLSCRYAAQKSSRCESLRLATRGLRGIRSNSMWAAAPLEHPRTHCNLCICFWGSLAHCAAQLPFRSCAALLNFARFWSRRCHCSTEGAGKTQGNAPPILCN